MDFFKRLFGKGDQAPSTPPPSTAQDDAWTAVYDARASLYEQYFGPQPQDIIKMMDMVGVWPGGGLFVIPADKLAPGTVVYATCGLTNPDMPTGVKRTQGKQTVTIGPDGSRSVTTEGVLSASGAKHAPSTKPGYGYELLIIARENAQWPLMLLQWAVHAEILNNAGILGLVTENNGLTVEQIGINQQDSVNILVATAQPPLPAGLDLPTGRADLLVITVVTNDEMRWALVHGRGALLSALMHSEVGQSSVLGRKSIVSLIEPGGDFSNVTTVEAAMELLEQGKLFKILLHPDELSGEDVPQNIVYVPGGVPEIKDQTTDTLIQMVQDGSIDGLAVNVEHKGNSVVPSKMVVKGTNSKTGRSYDMPIDIW